MGAPPADAFRHFFTSIRHGLYIGRVEGDQTTTVAANGAVKLMFGHAADEDEAGVRPFDADRFIDPAARTAWLARLRRDGQVEDYLLRFRRADGTPVWVEVTAAADPSGTDLVVHALLRDVGERKRLDDQARELQQQLIQAEKLAALGQTISGVAHELNNPLATILTTAERLARQEADPAARRGVETILGEAERAAKIVRQLLAFARKRHSTRTLVDLNQVARDTLSLRLHEQRLANVTVIDALATGLPPIFGDGHQLQQVVLNLVINAEQAMRSAHGRGTLIVRSWQAPAQDAVVLEVSDDGPGVPDEVMPRIFDPFFTTKSAGQGTGLGLTVAYAIVHEHGGRIEADSEPGRGAAFRLWLPTTGAVQAAAPAPRAAAFENVGGGAAVLVVEDEAPLAAAVADALRDAGFDPVTASDGADALARVSERAFDLVVCDLRMPRMDGPAFYRAIAAQSPELVRRVIFVTGDVAGTEAERFLEESGCRWLTKPFRLADLLRTAREVLG